MSSLFSNRWRYDKPPSIEKFEALFPDDRACAEFIAQARWPDGFVCPHCGSKRVWKMQARPGLFQCIGIDKNGLVCNRQTSIIAGTIMHGTKVPLRKWFLAAFWDMTHSNGISALQLQSKLELGSYKSAWLLLHKLRIAMAYRERSPLQGTVEVDEGYLPFRKSESITKGDSLITVAVATEVIDKNKIGRVRLQMVKDKSRAELRPFILNNTAPGTIVITDGNTSYGDLGERIHYVKNLSDPMALPAHIELPGVHRVISQCKRLFLGVFHGCREKHINSYLQEFEYRWNRRRHYATIIDNLMQLCAKLDPITYRSIVGDTTEWKRQNRQRIYKLVNPDRLKEAKLKAKEEGCDVFDILADMPPTKYERSIRSPVKRPVLGKPKTRRSRKPK